MNNVEVGIMETNLWVQNGVVTYSHGPRPLPSISWLVGQKQQSDTVCLENFDICISRTIKGRNGKLSVLSTVKLGAVNLPMISQNTKYIWADDYH